MASSSDAYRDWVAKDVAAIAHQHGLAGGGPSFRKRSGHVWTVFALERRRKDPRGAKESAGDPRTHFRMMLGFAISAIRPAWDTRSGPPGMHDLTTLAPTTVLEPAAGEPWHVFDSRDAASRDRLTQLVRAGLPRALDALGPADAGVILGMKLQHGGPLENLRPAAADELLALADLVGATDVRREVTAALTRPRVPDPERESLQAVLDLSADVFGPPLHVAVARSRGDDEIRPPIAGGRRTPKAREKLISELDHGRAEARRRSASALGAWTGDDEALAALRRALTNDDDYTRACAALSLGHLGDDDPATWASVLGQAAGAGTAANEVAEAIVLLARLDPGDRRAAGSEALGGLLQRFPANARRLAALAALLARA